MTRVLYFARSVERDLARLPREVVVRFMRAFDALLIDPSRPRPGLDIRPMRRERGVWRLRVGPYRAIYRFSKTEVTVYEVGHRGNFY